MKDSAQVDELTGRRSEDSVLFSLGSFPALRTVPPARAPASEGSGLIDIRAMRALINDDKAVDTLPSFGGGGLGAVPVAPLVAELPAPISATKPRPRSTTPLYALIGVLGLGVLGLGAVLVLDEPAATVVTREVVAPPEPAPATHTLDTQQSDQASQLESAAVVAEPEPDPEPQTEPTTPRRNHKPNQNRRNNTTKPTTATAASATKPTSQPTDKVDIDCLLNQKLPKCEDKAATGTKPPAPLTKEPTPTTELAKKLDQSEILAGIGPVKTAAKSCGSGTTVTIKFSVKGSTGAVLSADALDEHASSTVGKCVEQLATKAKFSKFTAEQQGFSFKFRL
jgi:hypothetical protein